MKPQIEMTTNFIFDGKLSDSHLKLAIHSGFIISLNIIIIINFFNIHN